MFASFFQLYVLKKKLKVFFFFLPCKPNCHVLDIVYLLGLLIQNPSNEYWMEGLQLSPILKETPIKNELYIYF